MFKPSLRSLAVLALAAGSAASASATDNGIEIVGGRTSVALDFATLAAAASLDFSSVSDSVFAAGVIPGSVAFGINPRDAVGDLLPTTFSYTLGSFLTTFSGTIEHEGSVFFNSDTVEVGNFTIGFDAARIDALDGASGFFVESTVGIAAVLFDIAAPNDLVDNGTHLGIEADLLVSPEFGQFLFDNGLSASNLQGADVGDARVSGDPGCTAVDQTDDGAINADDFNAFATSLVQGLTNGSAAGDFNGDGITTGSDFFLYVRSIRTCSTPKFAN
ncbi:MAG: hypothetical protein AAGF47_05270 [Planctomycetota bacterium]